MFEDGSVVLSQEHKYTSARTPNETTSINVIEAISFSLTPSHNDYSKFNSPIFCLPYELMIDIFKLLPTSDLLHVVPQVCQLWYKLSLTPVLRTKLVVRRQIPANYFLKALSTRPTLRRLSCPAFAHAGLLLPDAIKHCMFLECLNIGFCVFDEEATISLARNLPGTLLHLNVEGVNTIEIEFISTVVSICPKLEAVNLSHCVLVCDTCVKILTQGLDNLRRLNLDGELWLSDKGLSYISDGLAVRSGKLNALWLDGFEFSNSGLSHFFRKLVEIERLNIASPEVPICSLPNCSIGLSSLWISFCDHMEDDSLQYIAHLPNLISLTLRKAHQVSSYGFSSLFTSPYTRNCRSINQVLKSPSLMLLEHLDLSEATGVTNSVLSDICKCCGVRLRSLTLNWCWQLTDAGIDQIIDVCCELRQLSLVGNSQIQGYSFTHIPDKQAHLVVLNVAQCNLVRDEILEELALRMPNLYVFDFFGERVGGQGINDVCHFDLYRALGKPPICSDY